MGNYMRITGIPRKDSPSRWRLVRRAVLDRDGWRCCKCKRAAGRFEVDHIKPLHLGGEPWDLDNLQSLCPGCHINKTADENRARHARNNPKPRRDAWRKLVNELRT